MAQTQNTAPRDWTIDGDPVLLPLDEPDALEQGLWEVHAILKRIGGAVSIAAVRQEVAPDHYMTTHFLCKWTSYVPGIKQQPRLVEDPIDTPPEAA